MMNFGDRLKKLIHENGMDVSSFARAVGIKRVTVSCWINKGIVPRQDKINKVSDFFKVDPAWLLYGDNQRKTPFRSDIMKVASKLSDCSVKTVHAIDIIVDLVVSAESTLSMNNDLNKVIKKMKNRFKKTG